MKALGIIALVAIVIAAAASGNGDSDDKSASSSSSPVIEHTGISADAEEGLALTEEGSEISNRLAEWGAEGQKNPLGACASLEDRKDDVARLGEIVTELSGISGVDTAELSGLQNEMEGNLVAVENGCAALGF